MKNKQMMSAFLIGQWSRFQQAFFNLQYVGSRRDPGTVSDPVDVRVHRDSRLTEGGIQNNISRLAADARKGFKRRPGTRHSAFMTIDQNLAGFQYVCGFGVIKTDCPDMRPKRGQS